MSAVQALLDREAERIIRFTLDDGSQPDLLIVCESFKFLVHERKVVEKCKFFEKTMSVDWKEKNERKIVIQEKSPFIIQALLFYIYNGTYYDALTNESEQDPPLTFNVSMYAVADEYQMSGLKDTAQKKLLDLFRTPSAVDGEDLRTAVTLAYTQTRDEDGTFKQHISRACARDFGRLPEHLTRTMQEIPGFGSDVAHSLYVMVRSYECTRCTTHLGWLSRGLLNNVYCTQCREEKCSIAPRD